MFGFSDRELEYCRLQKVKLLMGLLIKRSLERCEILRLKKVHCLLMMAMLLSVVLARFAEVSFAAPKAPHGLISITFDDGWKSEYDYAFQLLQERGITATFYVISDYIRDFSGNNQYMSIAELQTLQTYGCEIGSHSKNHLSFTYLSDTEIHERCEISKQVLQSYGFSAVNFAYPYGDRNDHTDSIVPEYYRSARKAYDPPYYNEYPTSQFLLSGITGETGDPTVLSLT
jgi:peptidoglycan/xylan/chitin deacetylase (PgdA/CDA1 family)